MKAPETLRRELGLLHVFCIASGAMISSGIFVLPGLAYAKAGPSVVVSYLLAGILATFGMLSAAELATAMPKAGGDYFFVTRGMGPAVGSVSGILTWFSLSLKSAFALVGMSAFARLFIEADLRLIGVVLCAGFVGINLTGARHVGRFQTALVLGLLGLMLYYIVAGIPHVRITNLAPFVPHGVNSTLLTAGFVFVSYGGLLKISSVAEEVHDPGRSIPLGMMLSLAIVMLLYVAMVGVTAGVLNPEVLAGSLMPITEGARSFMGRRGAILLSCAAILAFISTANAGIMAASRYLLALSRDDLAPAGLGAINRRFQTPHTAILITGLFVAASLFLKIDVLVEAASLVLILGYILSCLCVIIMRESQVQNYRPSFRSPLYPWPQILGILGFLLLVLEMGPGAYLICLSLIAAGFCAFWFYGRTRTSQEYALLHLVQRVTSRELVTGSLETELKQIIRERDNIEIDRFDRIIIDCVVLDIAEPIDAKELFHRVAEAMAERVHIPPTRLEHLLAERENESSTVVMPHLALPHVVIDEKGVFDIALVRARQGVQFPGEKEAVTIAFVLLGSRDERAFHLRSLANIAQIAQSPDLEKQWMGARDAPSLRDVILLGKRNRG